MVEKLPAIADKDIGFILKNTGMTLLSSVGGASGPLFGTFFIRAAQATQARQSLTLEELYQMFRDGADGVISRGESLNLAIKPCVMCGAGGGIVTSVQRAKSLCSGGARSCQ